MSESAPREVKIRRPSIQPLEEWIDLFMRGLSMEVIDPAKPETRLKLRKYLTHWLRICLQSTSFHLQLGAERGIKQTLAFMFDPQHDKTVKSRRKAKAEKHTIRKREDAKAQAIKEIRGSVQ